MNATCHLDALADELAFAGWACVPRYEVTPVLLRVFAPSVPMIGESISVKAGVGGVPWFISSTGDPLTPCHDLTWACCEISARLAPLVIAARGHGSRPRRSWSARVWRTLSAARPRRG